MRDDNRHHEENLDASYIRNPDVRHERSDLRVKPVVSFLFWLMVSGVVIHLLVWGLFRMFEKREQKAEGKPSPFAAERNEIPPPPLLQLAPTEKGQRAPDLSKNQPLAEMGFLREEEDRRLDNYTWVDQQKGVVGIPIEDAKRLVLQRGLLQSRPQGAQNMNQGKGESPEAGPGEQMPAGSSSGRTQEKKNDEVKKP
jgi:hypothetical protein